MMLRSVVFSAVAVTTLVAQGCTDNPEELTPTSAGPSGSTSTSAGAGGDTGAGGSESGSGGSGAGGSAPESGYVFTMSNASDMNELIVFERSADGSLTERESVPTGGLGSGNGLGSQGALALSPDGDYLYVVNAGSHQISSFRIYDDHLALVDLVASGGERPVSVTASDDRVYVVNAGAPGTVAGFDSVDGVLSPINAASRPLSAADSAPAQIGLTPANDAVIVTEKATNNLLTYWVAPDGSLSDATVTPSEGMTPFGFEFSPTGTLVVSEAFGGASGASAVSSYMLGTVEPMPISSSVPNFQSAACWLLVVRGSFVYTTNTASNTISGYNLSAEGDLSLFDDDGETAILGADNSPLDMAVSADEQFLYVLNGKSDLVFGYMIASDGSLEKMDAELEIPETSFGLAAR